VFLALENRCIPARLGYIKSRNKASHLADAAAGVETLGVATVDGKGNAGRIKTDAQQEAFGGLVHV
ncbi:MAG: hypothetical protein KGL39_59265, partial [Patescibacteria group bacterium]|nr:hypothetical protein [Patescibacteria group bacterium]